ncbi:MAG: hypothetical protein ACPKPY_06070 [Nitrososphaeraceae archaeon]
MTHNGIDIDQFILLTIYPAVALFSISLVSKKIDIKTHRQYLMQAITCISFAIIYIVNIPNGGAQGLAIVLIIFSIILFLMARKHKLDPEEKYENIDKNKIKE